MSGSTPEPEHLTVRSPRKRAELELAEAARELSSAMAEVEVWRRARDQAIRDAANKGLSRREIAARAGMTAGRVQQILGR